MQYGEKITALRKSGGMTQADLGKELNVTFQAVSKWERDESIPDFETLSKIARLFGVPITYFEEGQTLETVEKEKEPPVVVVEEKPKMLGVCKHCGKVVNEGDEAQTEPFIICQSCQTRKEREKQAAIKAEQERKERERKSAEAARRAKQAMNIHYRNRGLIWGAVITAAILIIELICCICDPSEYVAYLVSMAIWAVCGYTFFSQLFWDGVIRDIALFSGKVVGMPGVIFSLDLDGVIFLIAAKIFFAILKMLIFIFTMLLGIFVAMLVAPFTFVPQMRKCARGELC